jgi:YD repeat-containing protein
MLRATDIDRVLSAARAQSKQRPVRRAEPQQPAVRIGPPVRGHGATITGRSNSRTIQSVQASSGTGINRWWRYQEQNVPGGGHVMVNVGTGNLLFQDDDMIVPHKGLSLAFRRTYNSQSLHTVAGGGLEDNGNGWAGPGMYGNGWTNTFDAHTVSISPTQESVYDIDGARYDYTLPADPAQWVPGMIATSVTPGNYTALVYDGACGWLWEKVTGTVYYFYTNNPSQNCPSLGTLGAYSGRLRQIIGRNRYVTLTFSYSWENGDATLATGKIHEITAQTESGMTATLAFAAVAGHQLLQSISFPGGATSVTYGYDTAGNLISVSRPANNAEGVRSQQTYGYQPVGAGSALYWIYSPRLNASNPFGSDGHFLAFLFAGTNQTTAGLSLIAHWAFVNPSIPDGSNSTVLQPGYATGGTYYQYEYYSTGVSTPTFRDTDGHATNWVVDSQGRPTQTQECTATVSQSCTGTYLVSNESWDANNNLVSEVDPRGAETDYAYDVDGNTVAVAGPAPSPGAFRPTSLYSYGAYDNLIAYCDPIATHAMQADWTSPPVPPLPGQGALCPAQSTAATRYQWGFPSWQPFGELTSATSPGTPAAPNGYQMTFAYDPARQGGVDYGLPTSVTGATITQNDPSTPARQAQQSFWYDGNGNLVCYGTGNGQWLLGYDALGRPTSTSDPDDSSSGTGTCGKTGTQPNWNTTTRTTYFPDGTVASKQTASQVANGTSTSFTYDVDGDPITETHHYGCVTLSGCTAGVTQKFYDGADRLVEVLQPWDAWDVQAYPWGTRYIYDLSQGGTTSYRGMGLAGYGNLVSTKELLSGSVWTANGSSYPISSGSWTDVRATAYDALDRVTGQYEASFSDTPKILNTYDGPSAIGLLATTRRATGEIRTNSYDRAGRLTDATYSGGADITPATHLSYDADGHLTSRSTDTLGAQIMQYDGTGKLTSVAQPATLGGGSIEYHYYADGLRKDVTYQSSANLLTAVSQYTYRDDGKRQTLQLVNGLRFGWTYTAAGREKSQSDPLTGTSIAPSATYTIGQGAPHPFYPASITYVARAVSYDTFGRVSGLTLPQGLFSYSYSPTQYDLDDSIIEESRHVYQQSGSGQPTPTIKPVCEISNVRNEKVPNAGTSSCSSFLNLRPHNNVNGTWLAQPSDIGGAGWWTLDARSGVRLNNLISDRNGVSVGAQYTYDASGRIASEYKGDDKGCRPGYLYANVQNPYCFVYGTRTKTYDAENRLHSDTYPYVDPTRPTQTSYGTSYGDYWMDLARFYQPATIAGVDYDAESHPTRISLYHPDQNSTQTLRWLWDGNDRFLQCAVVNGQCTSLTFSLEGLADYDPQANEITVYDRNLSGSVATYHTRTRFGSWTDSYGGVTIFPRNGNDVCSDGDASDSSSCVVLRSGKLTGDGWTIDNDTWQGVRTSDLSIGQWNTPDAYAGEVHDPMSQKPFMWNRNNPFQYADPSGFDATLLQQAYNELFGDDLKITIDKSLPQATRQAASGRLVSNFLGPGEIRAGKVLTGTALKVLRQAAEHGIQSLFKSARSLQNHIDIHLEKIAAAKAAGGFTSSMEKEVRDAQNEIAEINKLIEALQKKIQQSTSPR